MFMRTINKSKQKEKEERVAVITLNFNFSHSNENKNNSNNNKITSQACSWMEQHSNTSTNTLILSANSDDVRKWHPNIQTHIWEKTIIQKKKQYLYPYKFLMPVFTQPCTTYNTTTMPCNKMATTVKFV